MIELYKLQFKYGYANEWALVNPVLDVAEPGFEIDSRRVKLGDGVTNWNDLSYLDVDLGNALLSDKIDRSLLTENGQLITRTAGAPAPLTRQELAEDPAFKHVYASKSSGVFAPFTAVVEAIKNGRSTAIQVQGDGTGNSTIEWVYLMGQWFATKYPTLHVKYKLWSDSLQDYDTWTVIQQGSGERAAVFTGPTTSRTFYLDKLSIPSITGDIDVRVRVSLDNWANGSTQTLVARHTNTSGTKCWSFRVDSTGHLVFNWTTAGTSDITKTSTAIVPFAFYAQGWARAVLDVDNGASGNTVTFYTSTDGVNWTQLGSPVVTAGVTSIYDHASQEYEIGGRDLVQEVIVGSIFEVQIRDGIDGAIVNPQPIESWIGRASTGAYTAGSFSGSSTLYIINGSENTATTAYLSDSTRLPKMVHPYHGSLMFQSCSFTDAALSDTKFIQDRNSWLTALNTRVLACGVAVVTQNPARSPIEQNDIDNHARKRSKLTTWTAQNGCALIDTYKAFIDDGDLTALTQNDGVSPSTTGSQLWANTVTNAFDL